MSNNATTNDKASQEATASPQGDTAFENPLDQITVEQKRELQTVGEKAEHWHDRGALVRAEIRFALTEDGERKHEHPKFDQRILQLLPKPWTDTLIHATNWRVPFAMLARQVAEVRGEFNRSKFDMASLLLRDADGALLSSDGKADLREACKGILSLLCERVDAINSANDVLTSEHLVMLQSALEDYLKGTRSKEDRQKAAKKAAKEASEKAGESGKNMTAYEAIMGVIELRTMEEQGDKRLTGADALTIAKFLTEYADGLKA